MKEKLLILGLFFMVINSYGQTFHFPDTNFKNHWIYYSPLNDVIVYPNSSNNFVNIRSEEKVKKLTLYTFVGENVVGKQNTNELNISEIKRGVYWLVIEAKSKIIRKKILKKQHIS